jgi:hypothetical protein
MDRKASRFLGLIGGLPSAETAIRFAAPRSKQAAKSTQNRHFRKTPRRPSQGIF